MVRDLLQVLIHRVLLTVLIFAHLVGPFSSCVSKHLDVGTAFQILALVSACWTLLPRDPDRGWRDHVESGYSVQNMTPAPNFGEAELTRRLVRTVKATLPPVLLRIEGATLLALSILLYDLNGGSWLPFVLLFLAPDLSMLGYLAGNRVGAISYNLFHTYAAPGLLAAFGLLAGSSLAVSLALVWFAHIAFDRMVGFGLKYPIPRDTVHHRQTRLPLRSLP